jgi:chemotaxis protein MotB
MAKAQPASSEGGAPEYMVSYADMLTIMLAFFIVLYATTGTTSSGSQRGEKAGHGATPSKEAADRGSGPREGAGDRGQKGDLGKGQRTDVADKGDDSGKAEPPNEALQGVIRSLYYRFGPEWTVTNCWVGGPPELRTAAISRPKQGTGVRNNGKATWGQVGDDRYRARAPKPGENVLVGGRIYFDEFSAELGDAQRQKVRGAVEELAGKLQRIEIRGHTSRRPPPAGSPFRDPWDLAYARCRAVQEYLISQGIDPRRIRLGVAGDNEPLDGDGQLIPPKQNARVEIHLLGEILRTPSGLRDERQKPAPPAVTAPTSSPAPTSSAAPIPPASVPTPAAKK